MTRLAVNGIALNVEVSGDTDAPALLLLHGFTGDVSTWEDRGHPRTPAKGPIRSVLGDAWTDYRIVRVDLIGHGRSDAPTDAARYSMGHAVSDLVAVLAHLGIARTAMLGYSLGGRVALHLALAAPQRLWALVCESASPGIEDIDERAARVAADAALADSIERDGIEAFVDRWQAQALFASQSRLPAAVLEAQRRVRLSQSPRGLANSLRGMGAGAQEYLLPRLASLDVPSLFIAGALDERYAAMAPRLTATVPGAEQRIVPDAGHAVHLEQPAAFAAIVGDFLKRHAPDQANRRSQHASHT
jgi:2-succinyl-6-hydroxy-2,4-cyclohexadiene-1-carboxylate synthase